MFWLLPTTAAGPATGPPESSPNDHAISDTQGCAYVGSGFGPGHSLRPPVDRTWTYPTVEAMGRRYTFRTAGSRTYRAKVANLPGRAENDVPRFRSMATVAGVISMGAPLFCARLCSAWKRPVTKRGPQRRRQAGWLPVTRLQAETDARPRYSAPAGPVAGR